MNFLLAEGNCHERKVCIVGDRSFSPLELLVLVKKLCSCPFCARGEGGCRSRARLPGQVVPRSPPRDFLRGLLTQPSLARFKTATVSHINPLNATDDDPMSEEDESKADAPVGVPCVAIHGPLRRPCVRGVLGVRPGRDAQLVARRPLAPRCGRHARGCGLRGAAHGHPAALLRGPTRPSDQPRASAVS